MSRIRQEISSVQFQIDARKANASMEALQEKAKKLNESIEATEASIKALGDVKPDNENLLAYRKTLQGLKRDMNDVERAQRDLVKGVKAADKLWEAASKGKIEDMSIKGIKAGQRGLQQRMQSLNPKDGEDAKVLRAYKAVIEEADIVVKRFQSDTENLVSTIKSGGTVSVDVLTQAKNDLKGLMDLVGYGTAEWQGYKNQLDVVSTKLGSISADERRLAGEVVTVNDALKLSNSLTKEAIEERIHQAQVDKTCAEIFTKSAETAIQDNKKIIESTEQKIDATKKEIEAQQKLLEPIYALSDAEDKAEKEADQAREALKTQETEFKKYADAAFEAAGKVGDLKKKLEGLNGVNFGNPQINLGELEAEAEQAALKVEKLREELNGLSSAEPASSNKSSIDELKSEIKRKQHSVDWAKEQLEGLKNLSVLDAPDTTIIDFKKGLVERAKMLVPDLADRIERMSLEQILSMEPTGNEKFDKEVSNNRKYFTAQNKEKIAHYEEVIPRLSQAVKSLVEELNNAERAQSNVSKSSEEYAKKEKELEDAIAYQKQKTEELAEAKKRVAELSKAETDATQSSAEAEKEKAEVTQQLADAQKELEEAKKALIEPTEKLKKAEDALSDAEKKEEEATEALKKAKEGMNLGEEEDKLGELEKKHVELTEALKKQNEEQTMLNVTSTEAQEKDKQAAIELAQAQDVSEQSMEDALSILEKTQKATAEGTGEYEEQAKAIEALSQRIHELKGEWMSYAEAEELASQVGTDEFLATPRQLQQAQQALERYRDSLIKTIQQKKRDGDTTAEEDAELKKVTDDLKRMKFEMDNAGVSSKRMHELLDNPSSAKNLEELQMAVKRAQSELKLMEDTVGKGNKEYDTMSKKTREAGQRLKELENQFKASATAFEKAWSRLKTYVGLYVGAGVAMQKLTATMGDLLELSDKMGEVRKTTGFTADEVGRLTENLKKMDTRTGIVGLLELSASAGQLGLKTEEDVQGFTEAANKLMVALPEMGREAATQMLKVALATGEIDKIRKQMADGTIEGSSAVAVAMEKVGSTIDRLRATSASAAPAITDFVQRVGAVGAQSGISIDQIAALGSTVDALGMRVEMSATALSRMIPAIKNNAFEIAQAIGVTPEALRNLFETGRGMEAILMIFQHIKDAGMDDESIEQMLGIGNMKEIMKDLNQQGARAGIVFASLSQNVDELRRQLGVAAQAYEENIAIQNEYNKMNETTAAKWERLKNEMEEMFVGDQTQRWLGGIIDGLRKIVDLLAGDSGVSIILKTILIYIGLVKVQIASLVKGAISALISGLKNIGIMLGFIKGEMTAIQWSNIFTALAAAVMYAIYAFKEAKDEASRLREELNRLADENEAAVRHVDRLVQAFYNAASKANFAAQKHSELKEKTESLRKQVDELKKSTNLTAEATDTLNKKEEELKASEEKLKQAADESNQANNTRLQLIAEINSKYSTYLGYMLSEKTAAEQVASAHRLICAALKEELIQKSLNRREDAINSQYDKKIQDYSTESEEELRGIPVQSKQRIMDNFRRILTSISFDAESGKYSRYAVEGLSGESKGISETQMREEVRALLRQIVKNEVATVSGKITNKTLWGRGFQNIDDYIESIWGGALDNGFGDWVKTYISRERDIAKAYYDVGVETQTAHKHSVETAVKDIESNNMALAEIASNNQELTDDNIRMLAQHVNAITANLQKYEGEIKDVEQYVGVGNDVSLSNVVNTRLANLDKKTRDKVLAAAQKATTRGTSTSDVSPSVTSPWGSAPSAESTDYATWDVNELVARRNQMDKFKNVLKPDTDVMAVLAEDKALMKAITNREITADWKEVLNWYNKERLKIQEELKSERFSTNEGHWRDEADKKGRKRRNVFQESDYALAELDRYYSRRKEAMEKARAEENISEEMFNRQTELLEQEHLERRAKLRGTFTGEVSKEETEMFRQWWANLEKADELDHVPWDTVESEWAKAIASQIGKNNLNMQKDLTQLEAITMKHVNQIANIIAKERPYDGITENLQANLTKLDILFADMGALTKDQLEDGSMTKELSRRLSFLLDETEHAYTLTAEQLMADMGKKGFQEWADALTNNENGEELKRQLLAQLQKAYDAVQDAIKKEANILKKQAEIQWNDTTMPNGKSRKQTFEATLSALGLQEDQVKRANSLIGAGYASERVADKLAIKQMQVRLAMQEQYYNLIRKTGLERIAQLEKQGKLEDAAHLRKSLDLSLSEELKKTEEQRVAIANQLEESQNRLYTALKEWSTLLASSLQSVFEASHAGDKEYYNELAKLNLTGKGGPGAGTYIIIDNEGTSEASAHYEYLDEREALERQREIERQNAQAEAWEKVMDDFNMKLSETITDQINAMMQNQSIDANTQAVIANTEALYSTAGNNGSDGMNGTMPGDMGLNANGIPNALVPPSETSNIGGSGFDYTKPFYEQMDASNEAAKTLTENNKKAEKSTKSAFAAMTAAANMYGVAYQAMSNENLSTTQKVEMMMVQAAGQALISMLTAELAADTGETASHAPAWVSKTLKTLGPIGGPVAVGIFTALIGGLMGMAASKITKSKSQIAQATGASASAGRLATGMLTYAEGNVNEFTDPASLHEGRQYNVDAADGRTYRARYMGRNPKTHLTNGPEFHLSGERGREMIIDAGTTRQITMNDGEIWRTIQTLSGGGRMSLRGSRRGRGVAAFAGGNVEDFEGVDSGELTSESGFGAEQIASLQASIDRQSDLLDRALTDGIKGVFDVYGKGGLVDSYDTGKKTLKRHGERY